jgi:hypothetical protein
VVGIFWCFVNLIGSPYTGISWIARSISRPFCVDIRAYTSPHTLCILCIQQCCGRTRLNKTSRSVWQRAACNGAVTIRWFAPFVTIKCRWLGPLHLVRWFRTRWTPIKLPYCQLRISKYGGSRRNWVLGNRQVLFRFNHRQYFNPPFRCTMYLYVEIITVWDEYHFL